MMCTSCNSHEEKQIQLSIKHLPIIICFHLKRFEHSITKSTKIRTPITFPPYLNIGMYECMYEKQIQLSINTNMYVCIYAMYVCYVCMLFIYAMYIC